MECHCSKRLYSELSFEYTPVYLYAQCFAIPSKVLLTKMQMVVPIPFFLFFFPFFPFPPRKERLD